MSEIIQDKPSLIEFFKKIIFSSKSNVLLLALPFGFIAHFLKNEILIFVINFLAIIPLAQLLGFATEQLSCGVGQILAALLNVTFGNAVELIISIIALTKGQIRVVQASVLGSVLSNILVVLGSCFLFGGITILKEGRLEQNFDSTAAQASSSVMTLACIALIVPAAFSLAIDGNSNNTLSTTDSRILNLSYGSSVVLFVIYILYLYFQLKTHKDLFQTEENEELQISKYLALFLLVTVTVLMAFSAEFLVSSIEGVVTSHGLSKTFIGLVLLPIIGNAAEHATSVKIAMKDRMDFAISVAVGSSTQIALFVTPLLVILGWIIGQPMSLFFLPFETVCLFIAVLLSNYLVQVYGKSNWLEGALLIATYLIMALAFFFILIIINK
ncbi:vacuolar calcium ion transporter /H(+) exchanger [Gigaspora rosea]|uniref:Vacuolar calcium ion transporter n=2 Tax=Gigaspora TaxID=4873 RepID=A0A397TZF6_9GLOM|nr:vacuolar calcium ion transporter /H(+) exchanger [Gigaspora rosea]